MPARSPGISRRAFVRSAVAIGGASALAACLDRASEDLPQASTDPDALPERQHAWNEYLPTDEHGNDVGLEHNVLLDLEYVGDDIEGDREVVESALRTVERAYERGEGGIGFTLGYSPSYFGRFDDALPESVDLPAPERLAPFEDPALDDSDALLHLASNHGHALMGVEEALKGELDDLNGIAVEEDLSGVLEVVGRRSGFNGEGLPADHQDEIAEIADEEPIDDDAPLWMGFKSGFTHNQASEDRVTIEDGPFAGGTTEHLSKIDLNLRQWYLQDSRDQRVSKMFCPAHAEEGRVEGAGQNLGDSTGIEDCPSAEESASGGVVGHAQKVHRVREGDEPLLLRRDFSSSDGGEAATHFLSLQRSIADFVDTRAAMNGTDLDSATGIRNNNGILQYVDVRRRANYLVPPRSHRSLPRPNPE
ncbi:Tat pathway signal protein [Saliphagus sp. LR7]|uniref:DUF7405 family protein n=1 Tax=Saliphagus sp. LR7 TaxID=2282654 RepID=UPI000DF77A8C|nr:Tat pathway signal protein [Saliphagus sp. LR7]